MTPLEIVKVTPVTEAEVRRAAAGGPVELPGESAIAQADRIRSHAPPPRRPHYEADMIATLSKYGERLVIPRALAYAIGYFAKAGRPWAVAATAYWSGK